LKAKRRTRPSPLNLLEVAHLRERRRDRLLAEHVVAGPEERHHLVVVRLGRGQHERLVEVAEGEQLLDALELLPDHVLGANAVQRVR
jgi:hypothetical protein